MPSKQKTPKPSTSVFYVDSNGAASGSAANTGTVPVPVLSERGMIGKEQLKSDSIYIPNSAFNGLGPTLLPGEVEVSRASHVVRYEPFTDMSSGMLGMMSVTNFKISFQSISQPPHEIVAITRNNFVGEDDIVLNNIDTIYQVSKNKRKKLIAGKGYFTHVKKIEIHCKDFRIHSFNFKFSTKEECKKLVNALVHHAYPVRLNLQFAFEYRGDTSPITSSESGVPAIPSYTLKTDWERELQRLNVTTFKVTECNNSYQVCQSLPPCFVVPLDVKDSEITAVAPQYQVDRLPVWSYTHINGCSLLRGAAPIPDPAKPEVIKNQRPMLMSFYMRSFDPRRSSRRRFGSLSDISFSLPSVPSYGRKQRRESFRCHIPEDNLDIIKDAVTRAHPTQRYAVTVNLSESLPSIQEIQTSYERLREGCMPVKQKDILDTDGSWFSYLDTSRWLHLVKAALDASNNVVSTMTEKERNVILEEGDGRDHCPLVSCLVQVMLDSHCRTLEGFQCLVEREWVALGHNFTMRYGLLNPQEENLESKSPVFLLFLDCVWQLLQQYPSAFQFSEVFLTSLWDSVCMGMFSQFLFSSSRDRIYAMHKINAFTGAISSSSSKDSDKQILSVWDWQKQFSPEHISLFNNPLYVARTELDLDTGKIDNRTIRRLKTTGGSISKGRVRTNKGSCENLADSTITGEVFSQIYSRKGAALFEAVQQPLVLSNNPLYPQTGLPSLHLWSHCYLRWLAPIQIIAGGSPAEYLHQCILVEDIRYLRHRISALEVGEDQVDSDKRKSELIYSHNRHSNGGTSSVDTLFIAGDRAQQYFQSRLTSSFPYNVAGTFSNDGVTINSFLENSYIADSETDSVDELEQSIGSRESYTYTGYHGNPV